MKNLELIRLETGAEGSFGALKINKQAFCVTLDPRIIPAGQYICEKFDSPKFKSFTYKLIDVPGHTDIEFHPGNTMADTTGCILLGQYFDKLRDDRAVLNSGETFRRWLALMLPDRFIHLTITENF